MSRTPSEDLRRLEGIETPPYAIVAAKMNEWLLRTGTSVADLALRLGLGESTLNMFLRGAYGELNGKCNTRYIAARVWPYISSRWPEEEVEENDDLLDTKGYRTIRECVQMALEEGVNSVIYGPPSSEKSFVLKTLCARYRKLGKEVLYLYCGSEHAPTALLREIAMAANVWLRTNYERVFMRALTAEFRSRPHRVAIVLDEAQHLPIRTLEIVRELHDKTERGKRHGCGIVLAGSHSLMTDLFHPTRRARLEQLRSRFPYRVLLDGMTEPETREIAIRAFSNGKRAVLSERQMDACLSACRVTDPYVTGTSGRPLRDGEGKPGVRFYYSTRRLLHYVRQQKRRRLNLILAEEGV